MYICMAMAKSSRLFRNWKKDLNSSKVMPCKEIYCNSNKNNSLLFYFILMEHKACEMQHKIL